VAARTKAGAIEDTHYAGGLGFRFGDPGSGYDIEILSDNGQFAIAYPDSLWRLPATEIADRATMSDARDAFRRGASDFIEKPFNAQDFVSRILSCISHSQAQCEFRSSNVFDKNADTDTQSLCNTP